MSTPSNPRKPTRQLRYQRGSLTRVGNFWRARWREDKKLPKGTVLLKEDKLLPDGDVLRRVHHNEIIGYVKEFPTKQMAQRELDRRIRESDREPAPLPPDLRLIEVALCDSCRERLAAALQAIKQMTV